MSQCVRCGATFTCGVADAQSAQPCWCTELPPLQIDPAVPAQGRSCLCPDCLRAQLTEQEALKNPGTF
jgi:hypothetical protein